MTSLPGGGRPNPTATDTPLSIRGRACLKHLNQREQGDDCGGIDAGNDNPGNWLNQSLENPDTRKAVFMGGGGVMGMLVGGTVGEVLDSPALIGLLGLGVGVMVGGIMAGVNQTKTKFDNSAMICKAKNEQKTACKFSNNKNLFKNNITAIDNGGYKPKKNGMLTPNDSAANRTWGPQRTVVKSNGRTKVHKSEKANGLYDGQLKTGITYPQDKGQKKTLNKAAKDYKNREKFAFKGNKLKNGTTYTVGATSKVDENNYNHWAGRHDDSPDPGDLANRVKITTLLGAVLRQEDYASKKWIHDDPLYYRINAWKKLTSGAELSAQEKQYISSFNYQKYQNTTKDM